MPLDTLLSRHARYRPRHTAVVFEGERITFAELDLQSEPGRERAARARPAKGRQGRDRARELRRGDRALPRGGADRLVVVPLSPLLRGSGLTNLVNDSDARALVTNAALVPRARRRPRRARRRRRPTGSSCVDGTAAGYRSYRELARSGARDTAAARRDRPRRPVQHHLLVGDDRPAEGHRPHPRDPGGLLHRVRGELPHPPGERRPARRLARLQRRVPDADAGLLPRLHVRAHARASTPRR